MNCGNWGGLGISCISFMVFIGIIEYELWELGWIGDVLCYVCYVMGYHDITYKPIEYLMDATQSYI
jgi:hypothetical protein